VVALGFGGGQFFTPIFRSFDPASDIGSALVVKRPVIDTDPSPGHFSCG
jgi:hypothetical protein